MSPRRTFRSRDARAGSPILLFPMSGPGDLLDGVPGSGGDVLAERLLDERHEHRPARARYVAAEHFPAKGRVDPRAVELDGKLQLLRLLAQEGDDPLRGRRKARARVG